MRWKLKPQYFIHNPVIHPLPLAFFITTLLLYYLPNPTQSNPTQPTITAWELLWWVWVSGRDEILRLEACMYLRTQTRAWDLKFQCIWDLKRDFETWIWYIFEISNKVWDLNLLRIWNLKQDLEIWSCDIFEISNEILRPEASLVEEGWCVGNDQLNMYLGI